MKLPSIPTRARWRSNTSFESVAGSSGKSRKSICDFRRKSMLNTSRTSMEGRLSNVSLTWAEAGHTPQHANATSAARAMRTPRSDGRCAAFGISCGGEDRPTDSSRGLNHPEPCVESGVRHQLVMRAALDDSSTVHDDDRVGVTNRGESMRDDERRPALAEPGQCVLHPALGLRVEQAGRLVENEDARVLQHRARNRETLALAGPEPVPALADAGPVTLREAGAHSRAPR